MILFPAIDLKDGKVVRLKQGAYDQVTRYAEDPVSLAKSWAETGVEWVHMVDLDAALSGKPINRKIIAEVVTASGLKVQVGGGIRSVETARDYFSDGVERVVVGTKAVQDAEFLAAMGESFPNRVALGLDAKGGKIGIQGWTKTLDTTAEDFLKTAPLKGIYCLIYTDIEKDGMLQGPNIEALKKILAASDLSVICSGGISSLEDIRRLVDLEDCKLLGVIVGKALYEGKFTVQEALQVAKC